MLTFCWLKLCIVNCFEWDFGAMLVEFSTSCRDVNDTMLLLLYACSRLEASNQENSQLKQRMETLESDNRLNSSCDFKTCSYKACSVLTFVYVFPNYLKHSVGEHATPDPNRFHMLSLGGL